MNNEEKILEMLGQINGHLGKINDRLDKIENRLDKIEDRLDKIEDRLDKVEDRLDKVEDRLDKVEDRLDKVEAAQAEMQDTLRRVSVTQEGTVLPQLQLLYEGHCWMKEKIDSLASKSRVEELESDVAMLKDSVKLMRLELNALKKAQ